MKTYSVAERLDLIASAYCNSRLAELSRKCGIDKPTISKIRSGEMSFTPYYIDKLLTISPEINRSWLESGTGYPGDLSIELVKNRMKEVINEREKIIRQLLEQLETQRKVIEKLMK